MSEPSVDCIPQDKNERDTDLIHHISERLCFFFSNSNLRRDKFLQKILLDDVDTSNGFVPISTLLTFRTLQKWTTDPSKVVQTIKEDDECQSLLCLNETETAVGRIQPFTKEMLTSDDSVPRTIRIGNLPLVQTVDSVTNLVQKQYATSIEEIQSLFSPFGKVAMVHLIFNHVKGRAKSPVGKAFVEFDTVDGYHAAVQKLCPLENLEEKQVLILGGNEITVKTMEQYLEKQALKKAGGFKRSRKDHEEGDDTELTSLDPVQYTWEKGCIVLLKGLPDTCARATIAKFVLDYWGEQIQFRVDHQFGQTNGHVRFESPLEKIVDFVTAVNEGLLMEGIKLEAAVLEGEEEETYHKNFHEFLLKRKKVKADEGRNKKQFRRNFRGKR